LCLLFQKNFRNFKKTTCACARVCLREKPEPVETTIADFNQVLWHLWTAETVLNVSCSCKCWGTLSKHGSAEFIKKTYGAMVQATPEPKYDVTLAVPCGAPMDAKAAEDMATKVAQLSRNMMAGIFHAMFDKAAKREAGQLVQLDYRPGESIWFKPEGDRVIVIFSIFFDDADDVVIGRVFLSEIGKLVQGAPSVDVHLKDPPKELQGVRGLRAHGYASFLLEARHITPKQRDITISTLMQFRNYVHYHIKCSKAYLHIRMRNRVNLLLQVLNRAKQEAKPEQKKTFTRK
jgi:actin related protein 2/3 complex subunit 2